MNVTHRTLSNSMEQNSSEASSCWDSLLWNPNCSAVYKRARTGTYPESDKSSPHPHILFL